MADPLVKDMRKHTILIHSTRWHLAIADAQGQFILISFGGSTAQRCTWKPNATLPSDIWTIYEPDVS